MNGTRVDVKRFHGVIDAYDPTEIIPWRTYVTNTWKGSTSETVSWLFS